MKQSFVASCGLATALIACLQVQAADYAVRTSVAGDVILSLTGPITAVDGAIFLEQVNRHKPRIVELEGPGGDLLSAVRIGIIIHERYMWTHAVGPCRSACAYIWLAGLHMLVDEGVEIANHLPESLMDGHPNQRGIALFGWYLGKLDISVDVMKAFIDSATQFDTVPNEYFDMLEFARYWNAPVEIVDVNARPVIAARDPP